MSDTLKSPGHPSEPGTDEHAAGGGTGEIAFRCRHFRNDRPCVFHKQEGVHCSSCPHKDLVAERVLVVKLDSPGDVLRTTCLLPSLKTAYPASHITWLTREDSRPLLEHNPHIDAIVDRWDETFAVLQSEHFDVAINPDANPHAARLLQLAAAGCKLGIGWSEAGHVYCVNHEAEQWLHMGVSDAVKRQNRETYQTLLHRLCRLEQVDPRPQLYLTDQERQAARERLASLRVDRRRPIIGLNTGVGSRWPQKSWPLEHQVRLVHLVKELHPSWQLLLLGGPQEIERNRVLAQSCGELALDTGCQPLRPFAALVAQIHLLVTADTLALHLGLALDRQIVALFGPTSHAEIDLCGLGEKLFAELECLCCYQTSCDRSPTCMDLLGPGLVLGAIERRLGTIGLG
jgi:heptosyltransferase-2